MANKVKVARLTEDEMALLQAAREGRVSIKETGTDQDGSATLTVTPKPTDAQQALADAFVNAIERTRPPEKKTVANRKRNSPWSPKDGSPQLKLKRAMYQHGVPIDGVVSNEEIDLLNKIKPGVYCEGFVRVTLRKDRGLDVDYPVKTASQRLKLVNRFGIRSLTELLQRIIDEKENPTKYRRSEDMDLFE